MFRTAQRCPQHAPRLSQQTRCRELGQTTWVRLSNKMSVCDAGHVLRYHMAHVKDRVTLRTVIGNWWTGMGLEEQINIAG